MGSGCPGVAFFGDLCVFGDFGWQNTHKLFLIINNMLLAVAFNDVEVGRRAR
jgi:hypothetical protein